MNLNQADGGPKAARLLRHNFTPELLRLTLEKHGQKGLLAAAWTTRFGTQFEVTDPIATPLNTFLDIRSVWEVRPNTPAVARLITLTFED